MSSTDHLLRHDAVGYTIKPTRKDSVVRLTNIYFNKNSCENQQVLQEFNEYYSSHSNKSAISRSQSFVRGSQFRRSVRPVARKCSISENRDYLVDTINNNGIAVNGNVNGDEMVMAEAASYNCSNQVIVTQQVGNSDVDSEKTPQQSGESTPSGFCTPQPPSPFVATLERSANVYSQDGCPEMSPITNEKFTEAMKAIEYIDDLVDKLSESSDDTNYFTPQVSSISAVAHTLPALSTLSDSVDNNTVKARSSSLNSKLDQVDYTADGMIIRASNCEDLSVEDEQLVHTWNTSPTKGVSARKVNSVYRHSENKLLTDETSISVSKEAEENFVASYNEKFKKKQQRPFTISGSSFETSLKKALPYYLFEPFSFMPEEEQPQGIVVAIDIGSSHSGYAYSFFPQADKIHVMHIVENGYAGVTSNKVPSSLLLDVKHNFHSFGYRAREFYYQLSRKETKQWLFFENFKPKVSLNKNINAISMVKSASGVSIPLIEIYRHTFCYFRERVLSELRVMLPDDTTLDTKEIEWVITVPSNWPLGGVDLIQRAALDTGFDKNRLLVITESSAAASYCAAEILHGTLVGPECKADAKISQRLKQLHLMKKSSNRVDKVKELIVDCGGVTTNFAIQEWDEHGDFKLVSQKGISEGSAEVDELFRKLLNEIFSVEFMNSFKQKCPLGYLELFNAFESRKQICSFSRESAPFLNIPLPFSLIIHYKEVKFDGVDNAIKEYGDENITWTNQGMLRVTRERLAQLFCPAINAIMRAIGDALTTHSDIDLILLIGGFSRSPVLRQEIVQTFSGNRKIIIPPSPDTAILKGAVIRGWNKERVLSYRSRYTYGIPVLRKFDSKQHPESKHIHRNQHDWCVDVFDPLILANQEVGSFVTVKRKLTVGSKQLNLRIFLYQSSKEVTKLVTDENVKQIGHVDVDMTQIVRSHPDNTAGLPISVEVSFTFQCDGVLVVQAFDVQTRLPLETCTDARIEILVQESPLI